MDKQQWRAGKATAVYPHDDFPSAYIDGPGRSGYHDWTSRITLYADTVIAADALRDHIVKLLNEGDSLTAENNDLRKNLAASSHETNETALQRNNLSGQLSIAKAQINNQAELIATLRAELSDAQEIARMKGAEVQRLEGEREIDPRDDAVLDGLARVGINLDGPLWTRDGDMVRLLATDHDNGTTFVLIGEITEDTPSGPKHRLARFNKYGVIQGTVNAKQKHSIAPQQVRVNQTLRAIIPEFDMLMNWILVDLDRKLANGGGEVHA